LNNPNYIKIVKSPNDEDDLYGEENNDEMDPNEEENYGEENNGSQAPNEEEKKQKEIQR